MGIFGFIREAYQTLKVRYGQDTYENLFSFVNYVPQLLGFSILKEKIFVPFWVLHVCLLMYIYGMGTVVYQWKFAHSVSEFIKSYVNISLFIFVMNNTYWFLTKRQLLKSTLTEICESDQLAIANPIFRQKHGKLVSRVKIILILFFGFNMMNAFFIYVPHRVELPNNYAMTPCYGMEPITSSPNRQICQVLLFLQECSIITIVLSYQSLLLFLIAHTALLYQLLSQEIVTLNYFNQKVHFNNPIVVELLPILIRRHSILLSIIDKLKSLYSVPIGIDFGSNAVCICLFFYLPFQEWLQFSPLLIYCFLVFFLYCFLCQRLTNAAELFETSVYSCGWDNFDVKNKKAVYIMLRQAQKPVEILAADIVPVNIATFATTLQAMFKFITVVKV